MHSYRPGSPRYYRVGLHFWQNVPKPVRLLLIAIILVCAFAGLLRGQSVVRDQAKRSQPTDFTSLISHERSSFWSPIRPIRYNNGTHIDDQYAYLNPLGSGQEGSVAVYSTQDGTLVAVKTFSTIARIRARNKIPVELAGDFIDYTTSWPTEIEAGLLLNSLEASSYVPVLDYFILQGSVSWSWALVSPLIADGTLLSLAERERSTQNIATPDSLDGNYRAALEGLVSSLHVLHAIGLCHDDIKPDNIFVGGDRSHWVLGDLGNVREVGHVWHETTSWTRQNQLANCQENDLKRALKTYLLFLRAAAVSSDAFDRQFWAARSPWSRLYWNYARYPVDAGKLIDVLAALPLPSDEDVLDGALSGIGSDENLRKATERELTCTTLPRRLWFVKGPRPGRLYTPD